MSEDKDKEIQKSKKEIKEEKLKRRPSLEEKQKVLELHDAGVGHDEIGKIIGRPADVVKGIINELKGKIQNIDKQDLIDSLRRKHYWDKIKASLKDAAEIDYFEKEWAAIWSQLLAEQVVYTDEVMVRDLVMQDINCFRITTASADAHKRKDELEKMINAELDKDREEIDLTQVKMWRDEISMYTGALTALTKQYADAQDRKDILFKGLKTTRDQRFKELKESGRDIFTLVAMLNGLEERMKKGRMARLMAMSADKIKEDWQTPHVFADGEVDFILLNSESVEKIQKTNQEDNKKEEENE